MTTEKMPDDLLKTVQEDVKAATELETEGRAMLAGAQAIRQLMQKRLASRLALGPDDSVDISTGAIFRAAAPE